MPSDALYKPSVVVNNIEIFIKPNSLSYKTGFGERKVRTAHAGGVLRTYATEDIETQRGYAKFVMYTTVEHINEIETWQLNFDANTVSWQERGENRTMTNAIITNDPEINTGVEGETEIMFEGDPLV
jgi:hypothetical protein